MPKVKTSTTKSTAKKKKPIPVLTPEELSRKSPGTDKVKELFGAFVTSKTQSEKLIQKRQQIHITRELVTIVTQVALVGLLGFIGYTQYIQTVIVRDMQTSAKVCVEKTK